MPTRKSTTKKKAAGGNVVPLDFEGVQSRGGKKGSGTGKHYPEGDYAVKCIEAKLGHSEEKEKPRIEVIYEITAGKHKKGRVRDDLYLTENALWRVRNTLEAMGIKVPDKVVKLDITKLIGKELAVTLSDDEYDNKVRSRVTDTFLLSELDDSEDEDEDEEEDDEVDEDEEDADEDDDEDTGDDEDEEDSDDDDDDEEDELDLDI